MKTYEVISPFRLRDKKGNSLEGHTKVGQAVDLSKKDATRLIEAQCVVEIEDRMDRPPENRKRGRPKRDTNASQ